MSLYIACHSIYNEGMPTGKFTKTKQHRENISKALKGRPHPWREKEKITVQCPCGKEVFFTPGQIRKGHAKYCSRVCYYEYRKIYPVWELSHTKSGNQHWNNKGANAKYSALHLRVQKIRGKAEKCEKCGKVSKWIEWANLTGKYDDVFDYKQMCRSCHTYYDLARKSHAVGMPKGIDHKGGGLAR